MIFCKEQKTLWEKKMLVTSIFFPFSTMFATLYNYKPNHLSKNECVVCNSFDPFPNDKF